MGKGPCHTAHKFHSQSKQSSRQHKSQNGKAEASSMHDAAAVQRAAPPEVMQIADCRYEMA
jgi:hypothetical protein